MAEEEDCRVEINVWNRDLLMLHGRDEIWNLNSLEKAIQVVSSKLRPDLSEDDLEMVRNECIKIRNRMNSYRMSRARLLTLKSHWLDKKIQVPSYLVYTKPDSTLNSEPKPLHSKKGEKKFSKEKALQLINKFEFDETKYNILRNYCLRQKADILPPYDEVVDKSLSVNTPQDHDSSVKVTQK